MQRQATPKFFSSAGKYMPKKRARLKNFRVNYDTNGNMITDTSKGVTNVVYNHLNMPTQINVSGSKTGVVNYLYDANGIKQRKQTTENGTTITREYAGGFVYRNGALEFINTTEGYIEPTDAGFRYVYQLSDIWNNTRVAFSDTDADGTIDADTEIFETADFYPFGLKFEKATNVNRSSNYGLKYKTYQGQEVTEELGLNVHEWKYRIGDPAIGRFWQVDPLAEDYYYNSTHAFAENKLGLGIELEGAEVLTWLQMRAIKDAVQNPNGVGAHALGISQGLGNTVQGTLEAIMNPGQTLEGLANIAVAGAANGNVGTMMALDEALGTNAVGTLEAVGTGLEQAADDLINGNGIERGTVIGEAVGAVAGTKGANAVAKSVSTGAKVAKASSASKAVGPIKGHTRHGLNQSISRNDGRGVSVKGKLDAVKNPKSVTSQTGGKTKYKGQNATVILDKDGKVITTYGKPRGN